jgi:hypothetical protein
LASLDEIVGCLRCDEGDIGCSPGKETLVVAVATISAAGGGN